MKFAGCKFPPLNLTQNNGISKWSAWKKNKVERINMTVTSASFVLILFENKQLDFSQPHTIVHSKKSEKALSKVHNPVKIQIQSMQ